MFQAGLSGASVGSETAAELQYLVQAADEERLCDSCLKPPATSDALFLQ